jgi:subtilisin family serine protease
LAAVDALVPGDVILLEMQYAIEGVGGGQWGPAELEPSVWDATCAASQIGIIVVAAAGNGDQNLNGTAYQPYMDRRCWIDGVEEDSGAIIVGAGTADENHDRCQKNNAQLCDWPNPTHGSTYGSRVDVQAWGEHVFTLGRMYGMPNVEFAGRDPAQGYTYYFGGTSSASALVAGVVAALQSYVEAELGSRLGPLEMRDLLEETGIPQGGGAPGNIGKFPDIGAALLNQGASDCDSNGIPDKCEASRLYVDQDAPPGGDGASWENGYN